MWAYRSRRFSRRIGEDYRFKIGGIEMTHSDKHENHSYWEEVGLDTLFTLCLVTPIAIVVFFILQF
jgi:hypothetical protein